MKFYIGKIRIPVVEDEKLEITYGRKSQNVSILNFGDVTIMGNRELDQIRYSSFFPAVYGSYCDVGSGQLKKPIKYIQYLKELKDGDNEVRVRIPDLKINKIFQIKKITEKLHGGYGDIDYSIELEEYIKPTNNITSTSMVSDGSDIVMAFNGTLTGEYRETKTIEPQKYIVKAGDCLYAIAKQFNMSWQDIYNDNRDTIGNDPNMIYVGQELKIRGTRTDAKENIVFEGQ